MVGRNILIVDDEAPIREMIAVALEMAGYDCLEAENSQQAHAIIVDRKLDHGPALARTVPSDKRFSGSEAGACTTGRQSGERNMAQYQDKIEAHLIAVAEADRAPLLAELDSVRNLASN